MNSEIDSFIDKDLYEAVVNLMDEENYHDSLDLMVDDNLMLKDEYRNNLNSAWYLVGDIYYEKLEFEKAIFAFSRAVEYCPDHLNAWLALGNSYFEVDLYQQALRCFATICEVEPMNSDARFNLAGIQMDIGNYCDAAQNLELLKSQGSDVSKNLGICLEKIALIRKIDKDANIIKTL